MVQPTMPFSGLGAGYTHGLTLRFTPPPVIAAKEVDWAIDQFADVMANLG